MGRFDGRVAVITGAARGIGFGTAQRFASEGASIAIVDLDEAAAQEAAAKLELTDGAKAIGVGCDVSDSATAEAAIRRSSTGSAESTSSSTTPESPATTCSSR